MSLKVEQYVDLDTHGMFICTVTEARVISNVVTDLKQCGQVVLIRCLVMLRQIVLTEFLSQGFKLFAAFFI